MEIDMIDVKEAIYASSQRLDKSSREIYSLARAKAESERDYRMALARKIMELRADGVQATLIPDIARGETSDLKFNRDLTRDIFNSARDSMRALQSQLSSLQSILRTQDDI